MDFENILTLVVTLINTLCVAVLGVYNIRKEKKNKNISKKKVWYQTEVISDSKIEVHLTNLKKVLFSEDDIVTKCNHINEEMLDFFYNSINYVEFFDKKYCEKLKKDIMNAIDEILFGIVSTDDTLTRRDKEKILKIYRVKLIYLFYEFDMKIDEIEARK